MRSTRMRAGSETSTSSSRVRSRASATAATGPHLRGERDRPEPGRGDHERAVAAHEQVLRVAGHVDRAELARAVAARVERPQLALARHVERRAGGLHPVGLVDARLLHVGLRGAVAARGGRRRGHRRGRRAVRAAVLPPPPPIPPPPLGDSGRRRDATGVSRITRTPLRWA